MLKIPEKETYISISNITATAQNEKNRLPEILGRGVILKEPGAYDTNSLDIGVPNVIHCFNPTTRESSCHDLSRVYVGIITGTSGFGDPVDGLTHGPGIRRATTIWSALGDCEKAVTGDVLEQGTVTGALCAAGAVSPDENRELLAAGGLGGVVDGMAVKS